MSELISVAEGVSMLNMYAQRAKTSGAILENRHKVFEFNSKTLQGILTRIVDTKANMKAQNAYLLFKFACSSGQGSALKHTFEYLDINIGGLLEMPDGRFILMPEFCNINEKAFVNYENRVLPNANNFVKLKNDKINERGGVSSLLDIKTLFIYSKMIESSPSIYFYPAVSSKPRARPDYAEGYTDVLISNKSDLLSVSKAITSDYMVLDKHGDCCPPR
jgi:hypothetical protein